MKKMGKLKFITIGGFLTAMTIIFQSAPVFFPAIGLLFSPFSTLPIAIAAIFNISLGIAVYLSSAFILFFISMEETIILLFTTGILGIGIGTFLFRKGMPISILFSAIGLSIGMLLLTYFIGMAAFKELTYSLPFPLVFFIYVLFSLFYACIWNLFIKKFIHFLTIRKII